MSKLIEGYTPDQAKMILDYARIAIREHQTPNTADKKLMFELEKQLGMHRIEILAAAQAFTARKQ